MRATHDYLAYQGRYRETPRESDRVLIELVSARVPAGGRVLDVGCSTGNFLRHLHRARRNIRLAGCDVDDRVVRGVNYVLCDDGCRLPHVWPRMQRDICDPFPDAWAGSYDVVTANAVFYCLDDQQVGRALENIFRVLRPGGCLIVFDLFHRWEQRLTVREWSERYGEHTLHIRPVSLVKRLARSAGFASWEFLPFWSPPRDQPGDVADLTSWTPRGHPRSAVAFRGGLAQPWCHAVLTRP